MTQCVRANKWDGLHCILHVTTVVTLNVIRYLIEECKCDPMCRANNGWIPLHLACSGSNVNAVKYLTTQCRCDQCVKLMMVGVYYIQCEVIVVILM